MGLTQGFNGNFVNMDDVGIVAVPGPIPEPATALLLCGSARIPALRRLPGRVEPAPLG